MWLKYTNIINESLRIGYRNIRLILDSSLILWQILFPVVYIFMAGFTYSAFLPQGTMINGIPYLLYLASGMVVFQGIWGAYMMGSLVWEDKRNSMLIQLMTILTDRVSYVGGYLISTFFVVLISMAIVFVIYPSLILDSKFMDNPITNFLLLMYSTLTLTILFGCISFIISIKSKTTQKFNLANQGIFMILSFLSPALFPILQTPFEDI
ncbi:MAG: ABC transporter permease, partial [Candidatus Nitrosocosmicus sp.]|nr:ABC transporter permease [Candidatus Nitrosocosmicus sp.]